MKLDRLSLGLLFQRNSEAKDLERVLEKFFLRGGVKLDGAMLYGGERHAKLLAEVILTNQYPAQVNYKIGYFSEKATYRDTEKLKNIVDKIQSNFGGNLNSICIHEADYSRWWSPFIAEDCLISATPEAVDSLAQLKSFINSRGLLFAYSGNNADALSCACRGLVPDSLIIAKQFDLLWKTGKELVSSCVIKGIDVHIAAPFHQGWLFNLSGLRNKKPEFSNAIQMLNDFVNSSDLSLIELALGYQLLSYNNTTIIVGVNNENQLDEVIDAFNATDKLSKRDMDTLNSIRISSGPMPGPITI